MAAVAGSMAVGSSSSRPSSALMTRALAATELAHHGQGELVAVQPTGHVAEDVASGLCRPLAEDGRLALVGQLGGPAQRLLCLFAQTVMAIQCFAFINHETVLSWKACRRSATGDITGYYAMGPAVG